MTRALKIFLCLVGTAMTLGPAFAQPAPEAVCDWSFDRNPFPRDLTETQWAALGRFEEEKTWERRFDVYKAIYLARYPRFAACLESDAPGRVRNETALLDHLAQRFVNQPWTGALGWLVRDRLRAFATTRFEATGRIVCSFVLEDAADWPDLAAHLAVARRAIARGDDYFAMGLRVGIFRAPLHLNPDLTLFIDLGVDGADVDLLPEQAALPAERRDFVRAAERRGDLRAVLDTTAPCETG